MKKYFVNSSSASNQGPYELSKILELVNVKKLLETDTIYLAESDQWVMISEHREYSDYQKTATAPTVTLPALPFHPAPALAMSLASPSGPDSLWFLLKNGEKTGPFTYPDVLKMLQQKHVFEYEHGWKQGMETWLRLAEIPEFSAEHIRHLQKSKEAKKEDIFVKRKVDRMPYKCEIVAHNNKTFWSGYVTELSEGGAGAVIQNAMLMPGQNVYVHFRPGDRTQSFNVLCEVVSKKFVKNLKDRNAPLIYAIKFVNIPKHEKDLIKTLIEDVA